MSLSFFSDQCVPRQIVDELIARGHRVTLLREILPVRTPDDQVLEKARDLGVILVSINGDFADIVRYPPSRRCDRGSVAQSS
jgi:predicted nuclease of predicted toxin-antitoxin system